VRFFLAAIAALRMFFRAALRCFSLGIVPLLLMAFKVLHRALMRLGLLKRSKRSQVAAFAGLRIFLARIQTILARLQFANHALPQNSIIQMIVGRQRVAFRIELCSRDGSVNQWQVFVLRSEFISGKPLPLRFRRFRAMTATPVIIR
jgi:hypothetical protein